MAYWDNQYRAQLKEVLEDGQEHRSSGGTYKELLGHRLVLENPRNRLIHSGHRKWNMFAALGQFISFMQRDGGAAASNYYKASDLFGPPSKYQLVGPHGPRLFGKPTLDQLRRCQFALEGQQPGQFSTTRKAVCSLIDLKQDIRGPRRSLLAPSRTGLHSNARKEMPCTLNLQFLLRADEDGIQRLHMITNM